MKKSIFERQKVAPQQTGRECRVNIGFLYQYVLTSTKPCVLCHHYSSFLLFKYPFSNPILKMDISYPKK